MRSRPDLDDDLLRDALRDGWGFATDSLTFLPVGFGCHHWLATDGEGEHRFVTVDELVLEPLVQVRAAYGTAVVVRDAGLDEVVAPLHAVDGSLVLTLPNGWAISLFPFLDVADDTTGWRDAALDVVTRLHRIDAEVPARPDDLSIPQREGLAAALDALGSPWDRGPYGERARAHLDAHAADLVTLLDRYDRMAAVVLAEPERFVVTHGEPHHANVVRVADGGWALVDWDTACLAPPERDLWHLEHDAARLPVAARQEVLDLYRLWWDLTETAIYATDLHGPHDDEDAAVQWAGLVEHCDPTARWPEARIRG